MLAILFGLQTFAEDKENTPIRKRCDNTTAANNIENMGTSYSEECNKLAKAIWEWCISRSIWISLAHIPPGKQNPNAFTLKYAKAFQMMKKQPIHLKASRELLKSPSQPNEQHPIWNKVNLLVCLLSGRVYDLSPNAREILWPLGGQVRQSNIKLI